MTSTEETQSLLPVTPGGPRITVKASCFNCPFVVSESYRVQSDSGSNVYCAHPSFEKRQRVGDTVWDTPDFCPVIDIPAIRARARISHSLPGDVGTVSANDAFEMGYVFGMALRGQNLEDSRAVGRLLMADSFKLIHDRIDAAIKELGFDSFQNADSGICQAKRIIRAALTPSPCPGDVGMREALEKCAAGLEGLSAQNAADPLLQDWADGLAATARAALTPSALSDLQRLGQEYDDGSLGRFGHHPEPAIDFECEVEQIESIVADLEKGMRQGEPVPLERIERAMTFRVGGDPSAVAAKATLRELEKRASALSGDAGEGELTRASREAIELIDELNERATSRKFWGISQTMHNKLCTIRVTLARALPSHQGAE